MAVFVYPWWATLLNLSIALYLTLYLVRCNAHDAGATGQTNIHFMDNQPK